MNEHLRPLLPPLLSFGLAVLLTMAVRALARHWGVVARPRADRWHRKPTALLGGVAIFATVSTVCLVCCSWNGAMRAVMLSSSALFVIGLVDDLHPLKPYQKLIGQVLAAAAVLYSGLVLPWTGWALLNMAITLVWLVGITNAMNLLDNMDGLAAGIGAIASGFLALCFAAHGHAAESLLLVVFAASLVGFLVFNFNPASIFMGDCGSMFIGFFLASCALLSPAGGGRSRSLLPVLAVPVLVLFIPIFDTTLVTILRKLAGRPASQGGRDHTSHRLVALGLSERRAVLLLYGLAVVSGILALVVREVELQVSVAAIFAFTLVLTLLGVYLAKVKVYDEAEMRTAMAQPFVAFLVNVSYKRRIFEVLLDVTLIVVSYYGAFLLRFGSVPGTEGWEQWEKIVCALVGVQLAAFAVAGSYRGIWRYISVNDLLVYARGVGLGTLATFVVLEIAFAGEPGLAVLLLDMLLLFLLVAGTRLTFRILRSLLPPSRPTGRRALIYGAGDAGELLLRELLNNPHLSYIPVGFADDDPLKMGTKIHGYRVFGGNGTLPQICARNRVEEVLISSSRLSDERIAEIVRHCTAAQIPVRRLRIQLEQLGEQGEQSHFPRTLSSGNSSVNSVP